MVNTTAIVHTPACRPAGEGLLAFMSRRLGQRKKTSQSSLAGIV